MPRERLLLSVKLQSIVKNDRFQDTHFTSKSAPLKSGSATLARLENTTSTEIDILNQGNELTFITTS